MSSAGDQMNVIDEKRHRYPFCVVWTPIPVLSWLFPFIGHMGIATSRGVVRDFAGSYFVSDDNMAFGWPTRVWELDERAIRGGAETFDRAIQDASDEYKSHMHNLFCDNCHSHVALALNNAEYAEKSNWGMVSLAAMMLVRGRALGVRGFLAQWLPFVVLFVLFAGFVLLLNRTAV